MARKNDILSIYTKEVEDIREAGRLREKHRSLPPRAPA